MPKPSAKKTARSNRRTTAKDKAFAVVLQATGLSELTPVKPTRKTSPVKKVKAKSKK
jgi:hypothetical protein